MIYKIDSIIFRKVCITLLMINISVAYGAERIEMDSSVRRMIDEIEKGSLSLMQGCPYPYGPVHELNLYRFNRLANVVLTPGEKVSDQDKLDHLIGDRFYGERKKIIEDMIDRGIDPNNIVYQHYDNPLYESVLFKDVSFTEYLLQKGARPDTQTLRMMREYPQFKIVRSRLDLSLLEK